MALRGKKNTSHLWDMKCEQYWPEVGCSLIYGDVIVRSHSIDVYAEFVIRNMTISVVNKQYIFLHRALVHALTFHCEPIKQSNFLQFMASLNDKRLKTIFKQLIRPEPPPSGEEVARERNKRYEELNREEADIPGSLNRPALHLEKMFGECNYINAVYINSYTVKDRFLVCQTPLPDTVKDFLTLIIQESCSCIVFMDPPGLRDDMGSITKRVYHYQFQHWPQGNIVPDVSNFLQLVQDVDTMSGHGPVLVHCLYRNAAERNGLFCAVSNLIQKMRVEGEVSVVNTLRQVKVRRPLAIPNKDQYQLCYLAVRQFLSQIKSSSETAIYCNV